MIELRLPGARVLFTDREQGDVRDAASVAAIEAIAGRPLVRGLQVHGAIVRRVSELPPAPMAEADGQATARRDVATGVLVADCLPVAIAGRGAVAMVHAGWRGLAAGVLEEGVRAIRELGRPGTELSAAIGPGAGPCCYEVGDELRATFGTTGATLDLAGIARTRLNAAGVDHVENAGICTICDRRYFSVRRDGPRAGRQAGVAWLT